LPHATFCRMRYINTRRLLILCTIHAISFIASGSIIPLDVFTTTPTVGELITWF